jgi:Flp pilus assembly protein TadG
MALELAVVAPALLGVLALVLSFGRFASVSGQLEAASRDGARAATQSRSLTDAQARVDDITTDTLARAPRSCRETAQGEVVSGEFEPGQNVTVEVRCTVSFSDLGAWGVPGTTTVVRRFSSPLDPNRGVLP